MLFAEKTYLFKIDKSIITLIKKYKTLESCTLTNKLIC